MFPKDQDIKTSLESKEERQEQVAYKNKYHAGSHTVKTMPA